MGLCLNELLILKAQGITGFQTVVSLRKKSRTFRHRWNGFCNDVKE
jgi:hypothetical protein